MPPPIQTFEELTSLYGVSPKIVENIKNCGYSTPTPIQMQAVPAMLKVSILEVIYFQMTYVLKIL